MKHLCKSRAIFIGLFAVMSITANLVGQILDRTNLPIKEPLRKTYSELDSRNATAPPRFDVKAPAGAPNVVIILIDDMGFGVSEAFGGPVSTPTMDKLSDIGLDEGTQVAAYGASPKFTGKIERVTIEKKK